MTHTTPEERDRAAAASQLRHDLITPVNHILGFTELLIEEAEERGRGHLVDRLGSVRSLGKQVLEGIDHALTLASEVGLNADLAGLGQALLGPCGRITETCDDIEDSVGQATDRAFFLGDLAKIRDAAARLAAIAGRLSEPPTPRPD